MSWNPNQPPGPPGWAPPPQQPWTPPPAQPSWTHGPGYPPQQIPPAKKSNAGIWIAVLGIGGVFLLGFCGVVGYFATLGFAKTAAESECRNATGPARVTPCTKACDKDSFESCRTL